MAARVAERALEAMAYDRRGFVNKVEVRRLKVALDDHDTTAFWKLVDDVVGTTPI